MAHPCKHLGFPVWRILSHPDTRHSNPALLDCISLLYLKGKKCVMNCEEVDATEQDQLVDTHTDLYGVPDDLTLPLLTSEA